MGWEAREDTPDQVGIGNSDAESERLRLHSYVFSSLVLAMSACKIVQVASYIL